MQCKECNKSLFKCGYCGKWIHIHAIHSWYGKPPNRIYICYKCRNTDLQEEEF